MVNFTSTVVKDPQDYGPIVKSAEVGEPMAWKCKGCGSWSEYNQKHDKEIPEEWEQNDRGVFCEECKYD